MNKSINIFIVFFTLVIFGHIYFTIGESISPTTGKPTNPTIYSSADCTSMPDYDPNRVNAQTNQSDGTWSAQCIIQNKSS